MRKGRKPNDMRVSHLSDEVIAKTRKVESLNLSLDTGSKNRLKRYMSDLAKSRGVEEPNIDTKVMKLVLKYAKDPSLVEDQLNYLRHLTDPDGFKFSRNLRVYKMVNDAVNRFTLPNYTSFRWNRNYQKSLKELKDMASAMRLKVLTYSSDDDIKSALPKTTTHSGFTYIYSGKKKKGDNMEGIFKRYKSSEEIALQEGSFHNPILIGFRTQASGEFDDDGVRTMTCKHKLRLVSMYDLINIIAELKFAKPFQKALAKEDMYAGGKNYNEISSFISNARANFLYFKSIDYSSFDQSISSWLIEDAFEVVKSAFHNLSRDEERLFEVMVHDFIHKDFIVNEGVIHADRGVPSGSMWTQIIDSIVNVLVVKTYYNSHNAKASMMAMGDDNIIFTNLEHSIQDLATYVSKNFGLSVKTDDKSNEGLTRVDFPKFLSIYWKLDGQWRDPNQLLSRLVYPERWRNYQGIVGPEHVIFAFILTYRLGMDKLIDIQRFTRDYPISRSFVEKNVDSRYLPGAMAYIKEYGHVA